MGNEPTMQPDEGPRIGVAAQFAEHCVRVDVEGLGHFTMARKTAFAFARQVEGAADALGPEPPAPKGEGIDITEQLEGKEAEGG
jgi:hypothetical protein